MSSLSRLCSVEGCANKHLCKDYCSRHYQSYRKYGDPNQAKKLNYHGLSLTPEFRTWAAIKTRCHNPSADNYERYGGRGIKLCERWYSSPEIFYADMGPKPSPEHTIDRIDSNGDYSPDNCRWITLKEQVWSRKKNRNNTSGYIGVCQRYGKWEAKISMGTRKKRDTFVIGKYDDPEIAAIAYDTAVIFFRGNLGVTNIL